MAAEQAPVWFITGCSSGFGRALAALVLERGWRAAVTARDLGQVEALVAGHEGRGVALALDVTNPTQIAVAVQAAEARFGGIDVLVNNAGYGYQVSVEEGKDAAIRALFETNVFGLAALIRAVLPGMRARRRGAIVNISSVGGFVGFPGSGYYAATKHAVEGLSDALAKEVGPLGIQVLLRRARPVPYRLRPAVAQADAEPVRRLRADRECPPTAVGGPERHPARRPGAGRQGDHCGGAGDEAAAASRARRHRTRERAQESDGHARGNRRLEADKLGRRLPGGPGLIAPWGYYGGRTSGSSVGSVSGPNMPAHLMGDVVAFVN